MLMNELIGNYFRMIHADLPLLHRPSFLEGVASGRHFIDEGFGAVALLVCALGARFSNNPATLPPNAQSWQFAGWQWFDQVRSMRRLVPLTTTTPSDLQVTTLAAAYVGTLAMQHTNFPLVGYGLRLAQDLGVHRRMTYGAVPTIQEEERKRAFWCLMAMDRGMATHLGRSCNLQEEDFDVDYPADCDDEYFLTDDPKTAFKQPSSRPSSIAQFVWYLKLSRINARALRELYSLQGTDNLEDPETARDIVTGLDSELNDWMDSLPQHLRYDPNRDDLPFAAQAASLHAAYYNLRIFIHRPFITTPHDVPFPFPSYAICTNAARSCIQVLERYFVLSGPALIYQYHIGSLLQSGLILLLNLWQKLRAGTTSDAAAEFAHVNKALDMLMSLELHWDVAGRVWDMLNDIMSVVLARYQQHVDNSLEQPGGDTLPDQDILSNMPSQTQNPSGYSPSSNTESSTHVSTAGSDVTEHVPDDSFGLLSSTSSWHSASFSTTNFKLVEEGFEPDFEAMIADLLPTLGYDDLLGSFGAQPHSGSAQVLGTEIATELGDSPSYESSASDWDSHFYEE
ncbi:fungal specific transcription factor domain-containing protein [Phanerochaete sordida]|uniref:Fungal specific transcription factor domain-containing protein n=1 Tax=Phanerochaete sordida TaxID=48140 RepID=A0A9P3G7R7_9APHY|nr:fungal specific transcription factor domain-containing protein [Phanerochaete sordida]